MPDVGSRAGRSRRPGLGARPMCWAICRAPGDPPLGRPAQGAGGGRRARRPAQLRGGVPPLQPVGRGVRRLGSRRSTGTAHGACGSPGCRSSARADRADTAAATVALRLTAPSPCRPSLRRTRASVRAWLGRMEQRAAIVAGGGASVAQHAAAARARRPGELCPGARAWPDPGAGRGRRAACWASSPT